MRDLERDLRTLSPSVAWPETPDLAAAVRPRLDAPARVRRPALPRRRIAAAVVALLLGGVAAVEPARSAVLELLGLKSVRIERREPTATPRPPAADLGLGRPVAVAQVRRASPPPSALGVPDGAFRDEAGAITYVYGDPPDALVTLLEATIAPSVEKSLGAGARLERFRIGDDPAYFISGARHGVAFADAHGTVRFDEQRLAGNTLLLERDGRLIRIEADVTRARAAAIADSIP